MSVWERLGDAETHARLLGHPAHQAVAAAVRDVIGGVRDASQREELRGPQERLLDRLLEAERRYAEQSRLTKLQRGNPIDSLFWRRACVQLRAVGDAIAWKFLGYDRAKILLLSRNQRPGLLFGKAGSDAEWQACNAHWNEGRPALLCGITNMITATDLLIADGDTLLVHEVKTSRAKMKPAQRERMRSLDQELRTSRISTQKGVIHVMQSDVPLATYWKDAEPHIDSAMQHGVSTWVPTPGVAVMFTAPLHGRFASREEVEARFETVQTAAGIQMGPMTHRIVVHSYSYPYRPNTAAPLPLLPIPAAHAAMILSGEIVFKVELAVDRLVAELEQRGMSVEIVLDESHDELKSESPILKWASGERRGIINAGVAEQIGIELNDLGRWAEAVSRTRPPDGEARAGMYLCLADEGDVWA